MYEHESGSTFVAHEPCPKCGSSDNLARYSDGHAHCFSAGCDYHETAQGEARVVPAETKHSNLVQGEVCALLRRQISEETCAKWNYQVGKFKGKTVQIANYMRDGKVIAQKIRFFNKDFLFLGDTKNCGLYGQHLWRDGGKMVVVTEGEIDALTVSQLQGNKWAVVSVPNGAQGAKKSLQKELEWLEKFESIILMFDNDEPGRAAARECASLFTPGKAKIATLPLKDPNEMLVKGRGAEVIDAMWGAKPYRPDGIVSVSDVRDRLLKPIEWGLSWPWESLTKATYGIRPGEIYTLGAGTGMGKSDIWKETIAHIITAHGQKVGALFLEETVDHTLRCVAAKIDRVLYHLPDAEFDRERLLQTVDALDGLLFLYDHFGYTDYEIIKSRIRYMVVSLGCRYIFLDHITALVTGDKENDERRQLDYIMTDLASLCRELSFSLFVISHLATPEGKPHEEGGRVMLRHFRGSRAIGQWSNYVFGLERNQQHSDEKLRMVSIFRILKDRYTGRSTGLTFPMGYEQATGRVYEMDTNPFEDERGQDNGTEEVF